MTRDTNPHIGHMAGDVYRCLEHSRKPLSVMGLSISLGIWPWDVFMALGWLAREDKVRFRRNLAALMVELKK